MRILRPGGWCFAGFKSDFIGKNGDKKILNGMPKQTAFIMN